jgi:Na+/H+ antiporter NhaC
MPSSETPEVEDAESQRAVTMDFYGGRLASALPLVFFVIWAIVQSAIFRIGAASGLVLGVLLGLIIGMVLVKGSWRNYANAIFEGMSKKVAVTAIVAWLWAGMFANTLQAGGFVEGLVWLASAVGVGKLLFPAVSFVLAALLATGIGTGYGTTIAFVTLFFPAGVLLGSNPVLLFGAILSGAVFGDNLAPVSDTTIVSAVTQDSDIGGVVASRFKYASIAAVLALILFVVFSAQMGGVDVDQSARSVLIERGNPLGLVHLLSMAVVIFTAVIGRHIIEAISWGIFSAAGFNLVLGLHEFVPADSPLSGLPDRVIAFQKMLVFKVEETVPIADQVAGLPFVRLVEQGESAVAGSLYSGAVGFFPMCVLVLLIVAAAQVMIRGGAFEVIEQFLLRTVARTVRTAETTLVLGTALVNGMITINTAAEIAIAPYVANVGKKFNLNGYRRANILDANTSALGYIFPWSGGVLIGYTAMADLTEQYEWFTLDMMVNPVEVWPYVFHGWILLFVFILAAWTGFGREYTSDRTSEEVAQV